MGRIPDVQIVMIPPPVEIAVIATPRRSLVQTAVVASQAAEP